MAHPPAGWYRNPDPDNPQSLRWWSGSEWSTQVQQLNEPAKGTTHAKLKPSTIVGGSLLLAAALISWITNGVSGFLVVASLTAVITAAYTLVTKRPSWAQIPSRKAAALVSTVGVLALIGGALIPGTPRAEPVALEKTGVQQPAEVTPLEVDTSEPKTIADPDTTELDPDVPPSVSFTPSVVAADTTVTAKSATEILETLEVKGRAPKTGYDRKAKFGSPWMDVDKNGCDTRNDILKRDLVSPTLSGSCKVLSGTLNDPYSGLAVTFQRGTSTSPLVQIDHVVALSDAWQKGAQQLTQHQRITLANDPLNLIAVDAPTNANKGDGDAATWLPKNSAYRCEYVARQISVKATYGLWVTQAEKDSMKSVLSACPDQQGTSSQFTPAPPPPPEPEAVVETPAVPEPVAAPVPAPAPAPADPAPPANVHYQNCTAARAAGAAPVYSGQPGYGRHLDRDGDGVGCE